MRTLIFVLLMLSACEVFSAVPGMAEVRRLYKMSATEKATCEKLVQLLKPYNEHNNPLLAGYRACATMMMANYVSNPYTKWQSFSEGKSLLEKAINADPDNIELRFLRFSAQTKAPSFLGYNDKIQDDKIYILRFISREENGQLKQAIISFMENSDYLTATEKQKLR